MRERRHDGGALANGDDAVSEAEVTAVERHWDGLAAYCHPDNKVSLGFMEGLNNKIRVIQRRAYGIKDQRYLKLKVLTSFIQDP